ncbi:hypothetical protein BDBG_02956 [Blastomyces gilchristii SLH14081]|uniref:Uncharacterized protein n=1 Tax=Blastomyces gilchristii (strain SLH14081) TaxID=559298 RepID=A0A179UHT2_BLAGS|nr:uncharacterized protein BDBG_02956 [Blastomyces gilchristii SLH14081]OAT06799.1 hypothetical protein BDBG_02956 [Blastomyces gilchristii SLH14081]
MLINNALLRLQLAWRNCQDQKRLGKQLDPKQPQQAVLRPFDPAESLTSTTEGNDPPSKVLLCQTSGQPACLQFQFYSALWRPVRGRLRNVRSLIQRSLTPIAALSATSVGTDRYA